MMNKQLILATFLVMGFFSASTLAEEVNKPAAKADFFKIVDKNADGKVTQTEFIAAMEKKFHSMDVDKSDVVSVDEFKVYGQKLPPDNKAKNPPVAAEKLLSQEDFVHLFDKRGEQEFSQLDKNHDNKLTAAELGVNQKKPKKSSKKPVAEKLLSKEDFIALFRKHAATAFDSLDKSHDHRLSETELGLPKPALPITAKVIPQPQPKPPAPLTDQQKQVNALFDGIDANKDGLISYAEKNAAFIRFFNQLDTNHDQLITPDEMIAARYKSSPPPQSNVTADSP